MYSVSVEVQSGMKEATSAEETADAEKWGKQGYGNDWGQAEESSLKPDPLGDHPPPPHTHSSSTPHPPQYAHAMKPTSYGATGRSGVSRV